MKASSLVFALATALASCDDRVAYQKPDPTWARMLEQRRADPWAATSAFPDGKVMQHPPLGTIAVDDDSDAPPPRVTRALLELGHARFDATCGVCHGVTGTGESVVATKMPIRPPPSLVDGDRRRKTRQEIYAVATEGYGLMSGYSDVLSREERWAVAAYVQALQLSQHAPVAKLPPSFVLELSRSQEAR